jgi:hypothetical protein
VIVTIKLEVGKTYVDSEDNLSTVDAIVNNFALCRDEDKLHWFSLDGVLYGESCYPPETLSPSGYGEELNLIAEHKEPVVHEAWVVWHTGCEFSGGTFCSLTRVEPNKAQTMNGGEILHIEKITYEEK